MKRKNSRRTTHIPQVRLDTTNPYKIKLHHRYSELLHTGRHTQSSRQHKSDVGYRKQRNTHKARNRVDLYEDKQVERLCKEVTEKHATKKGSAGSRHLPAHRFA